MMAFNPKQALGMPSPISSEENISLQDVFGFLGRNLVTVLVCVIMGVCLGGSYVIHTPSSYTAEARLIIDTSQARIALQDTPSYSLMMESAQVDSEVEIVKSRSVALSVIRHLNLADDPEYNRPPGLLDRLRRMVKSAMGSVPSDAADIEDSNLRRVMSAYYSRLGVRRLGQSYVLEIAYSSLSARRAAEVANAVVDAYIAAKVDAKADAARRGADWLEIRLDELGRQANRAAAEVERFKATQGIVKADTGGSLAQRQLMDTSAQLLQARSETSRLQARLDAIDTMLATGAIGDANVADPSANGIVTTLRQRMIDATSRQTDTIARYGPDGAAAAAVARDIEQIGSEIKDELYRVRRVYSTDLEAARLNQSMTDGSFETMLEGTAEKSGQYVRLAELESQASTYRRMYETMLQQFTQTVQRTSFPVSDARIVTPAVAPFTTSAPKSVLIIALSTVLGAVSGFGLAIFREALSMRIASAKQIERQIGVPCLGSMPRENFIARLMVSRRLGQLAESRPSGTSRTREVLLRPTSGFTATMCSVKVSLDLSLNQKLPIQIGITSVSEDSNRFCLASNLAFLYAAEGYRTLLIDADPLQQKLTQSLAAKPAEPSSATPLLAKNLLPAGLPGVIVGIGTGLDFAPGIQPSQSSRHRSIAQLKQRLVELRDQYDVIIVDLPPLRSAPDARAAAPYLDGVIISCRYLVTTVSELGEAVLSFGPSANRIKGLIIDGVPTARAHV